MAEKMETLTGLSHDEAREFHGFFVSGFIGFTVIAIIAHVLVWQWRPWFPGVKGYALLEDGALPALASIASLIA